MLLLPTGRDSRGNASLEVVLLVPALVMMIGLVVGGARIAVAHTSVESAARASVRAASLERSPHQARTAASGVAEASLASSALECAPARVSVDTRGFAVPVGQPATITATVTCTVPLSDIAIPGLPGQQIITKTITAPLDTYRER